MLVSARIAIDSDDTFYLEHLPTIKGILKTGLTVNVKEDFPNFHDMTLIQYAIAKRKSKTLKYMLGEVKSFGINANDILYPKTSNTRVNLIRLAIEFGSKGIYDDVNNKCLEVIIDTFKEDVAKDTKITSRSLIQAIQYNNEEAIKILLEANADLLYPLGKKENKIIKYKLSEMPIMTLFKLHNNKNQLTEIFNTLLKPQKVSIIKRLNKLNIDDKQFLIVLRDFNLDNAMEYLIGEFPNEEDSIVVIDKEEGKEKEKEQEKEKEKEEENHQCVNCHGDLCFDPKRGKLFCPNCNGEDDE